VIARLRHDDTLIATLEYQVRQIRGFYGDKSTLLFEALVALAEDYGDDPRGVPIRSQLDAVTPEVVAGPEKEFFVAMNGAKKAELSGDIDGALRFQQLMVSWFERNAPDVDGRLQAMQVYAEYLGHAGRAGEAVEAWQRALAQYDRTEMTDPTELLDVLTGLASMQLESGHSESVIPTLARADAIDSKSLTDYAMKIRVLRARAHAELGEHQAVIKLLDGKTLEDLRTSGPPDLVAFACWSLARALYERPHERARALQLAGDAVAAFSKVIAEWPTGPLKHGLETLFEGHRAAVEAWVKARKT
jgi:tetratricopeptide (TPR) repeat protein